MHDAGGAVAKVSFAGPRIARFACDKGKAQAFWWDAAAPGLGVRVTPNGVRADVSQSEFQSRTLRMTISGVAVWSIATAQDKARELPA